MTTTLRTAALVAALVAGGCGPRYARVSGTAVEDGRPYQATGEAVQILLTCDSPSQSQSASVKPDGTFKFYGPEGRGLMPGKYKLGISSDTERAPGTKKRVREVSPEKSSLELDLSDASEAVLTIDIIKQTMTR